jgi:hypothetical protein
MLCDHFDRLACFNFAILIARTFFIMRRKVALSAALSVVLMRSAVIQLVQIAKSYFY